MSGVGSCLSGDGSCCRLRTRGGSWDDPKSKVRGKADLDLVTTGLLYKRGRNHDEDDVHDEGLQAPRSKVDPEQGVAESDVRDSGGGDGAPAKMDCGGDHDEGGRSCGLGLLELLGPRLISGEDGEDLDGDEYV